ncbi:MAG: carboxypeptidase regulatory-like domain-containing protein [Bryobacteraceae bacterium]
MAGLYPYSYKMARSNYSRQRIVENGMFRLAIIALLFAQSLLHAQTPGKITGRVTDAVTHQPIPKVHVSCTVGSQFVGSLTAVDGSYTLEDVPAGPVRMTINLDGYKMIYERSDESAQFQIASGDVVTRNFEMHPLGRIYGKLVDRDSGEPIKGHTVSAVSKDYVPGHTFLVPRPGDQDGEEFNIRNLDPGDYFIRIDRAEQGTFVFSPDVLSPNAAPTPASQQSYGQRWYPDVPRIEMASPIHLGEGESRSLRIALQSRETHSLSGIIDAPRDFNRLPVAIVLEPSDASPLQGSFAVMPAPGPFRIDNLAPGSYRLSLTGGKPPDNVRSHEAYMLAEMDRTFASGRPPDEVFGDYVFEVTDHDVFNFKAALTPYAGVSGEVRMLEEDAKLPGKLAVVMMPTADFLIELNGGGAIGGGPVPIRSSAVESGRFHQEWLRSGEYWPQLRLPPGYAVAQALFEGSSPRNTSMTLSGPATPLTFVVTSRPGAVAGVVRDDNQTAVRGVSVVLLTDPLPDQVAPGMVRVEEAGDDGSFAFHDLAPGKYRALVLTRPDRAYEGDPGYLREQAERVDSFEVRAGQLVNVTLKR